MHLSTQHVYRLSCQCYVVVISPWHTHLKNPIIRHVALTRCRHRYRMWNSLDNKDFSVHFVPTGILLQLTTIRTLHSESLPLLWHLGSESRTVLLWWWTSVGVCLCTRANKLHHRKYTMCTFKMHFLQKFNFCRMYIIFITVSLFQSHDILLWYSGCAFVQEHVF